MIVVVRSKLIVLLVGAMILIQSGPLPACLLDEAMAACLSMTTVPVPEHQPVVHTPRGNDTPDELSRGWAQQQSFGSNGSVQSLAHFQMALVAAPPRSDLVVTTDRFAIVRCDARSTSPPFDSRARRFPLLT